MRVLIVEDDQTMRMLLRRLLESWGHEVEVATNGEEAWEKLESAPFPLVICDWLMPKMSGVELCKRVRDRPGAPYVYFILLTGKNDQQSVLDGLESGADDFLGKPFDPPELRARLRVGERILNLEEQLSQRMRDLARSHRQILQDVETAARIQQAMLPGDLSYIEEVEVAWRLRPCASLAGDTLNAFLLDKDHMGLYLLDVSGHGVAASLLSVTLSRLLTPQQGHSILTKTSVRGAGLYDILPPGVVLSRLNERFQVDESASGQHFTIIYAVLDLRDGMLGYSVAGHPPAIYQPKGERPGPAESGGPPIGFSPQSDFPTRQLSLAKGDRFFIHSDGLLDARQVQLEDGHDQAWLVAEIDRAAGSALGDCVDAILDKGLGPYARATPPADDVSVLAIEWRGN